METVADQAKAAAKAAIEENPYFDAEGIATLTYLDGYMAGHKAAMQAAAEIAEEVFAQ